MSSMIKSKESVLKAIQEYDGLGRDAFLKKHGFGKAKNYFLDHKGKMYDSKPIVGVAYGYENPETGPLSPSDFHGGEATVKVYLENLGFNVKFLNQDKARKNTYILTWNPERWEWEDFDEVVTRSEKGETISINWSSGNTKKILPADRVFLYRQANNRGLLGAGYANSKVFLAPHWDGSDKKSKSVDVNWETILPVENVLGVDILLKEIDAVKWNSIQASGISIPEGYVDKIELLWNQHLAKNGFTTDQYDKEILAPDSYPEGTVRTVTVNAYERNPKARKACIDHWGYDCGVCDFNFGKRYGELGEGYIHVHHLKDIALIAEKYNVDPIKDLRPVCPNCHAMLHRKTPALSIEDLREILKS